MGAPGKIRTFNLLIRSQVLYPLSYGRRSQSNGHESSVRRPMLWSALGIRGARWNPMSAGPAKAQARPLQWSFRADGGGGEI